LYRHPLVDINNINVPGQRICSHFLVQIPRADAEIVTNKLSLIFFFLLICYFCILMYNIPTRIFIDLYLKNKRQHFRVFVYKSNLYFFSYEIAEFRIKNYLNHYLKRSDHFLGTLKFLHTISVSSSDSLVIGFRCMFYKWDQLLN
jgi:hypothetical protein